ncbi:MAG TPA: SDR family oxidoreductase [Pirellulaceae bacterium]|nr:SDR family oxidoreductase [Planctomycetales bacterium]MCB9939333.1 SDR family oxidoreductase [Planctomycetaceae bacterium]HRX80515.1 SDR family oxidoreductase [Pirellulaceae bacterium]
MDQRKILITGVSRGLGRAMAEEFIRLGHRVAGCARSPQAVAELSERFPSPHRFDVVDVSNDNQVAGWANLVIRNIGAPDLLLNNAGLINDNASLWNVPPDEFSRVVDVNIKGVYHVIRHFVPAMIERETGVIINFSSGWGRSTSPMVAPYCATKWAIEGMTRALADDLPYGMAAIPLNPGIIHTEMLDSCFGKNAVAYPCAEQWAKKAVPFLLDLGHEDNGDPLTAPA